MKRKAGRKLTPHGKTNRARVLDTTGDSIRHALQEQQARIDAERVDAPAAPLPIIVPPTK